MHEQHDKSTGLVRTRIWSRVIDSPLAESEPFFLLLGPTEWLSEQLLRGSRGPRPRSAWFSRESFAGLFASGAWADVALLAQPAAGHDHPPPVPAAPAALPAAHVLLACSWCKQELRAAHAAKPPLPEALQLALEFWHAARARLVAVEPVNWAKSGSMLHFCCLVRESLVMPTEWPAFPLRMCMEMQKLFHCRMCGSSCRGTQAPI